MFIGHFAVGFAAKRLAPAASLAPLLAAPLLADLLWPIFLLMGLERVQINAPGSNPFLTLTFTSYPWSHSLVTNVVWGGLFGGAYYLVTRYRPGAWVIGLSVVSHWVLDVATHVPDMPLAPGHSMIVGLGLWRSVAGTVAVEGIMFVVGVWLYAQATKPRDAIGRYGWWGLVLLTVVAYIGNLSGSVPASVAALVWTAVIASVVTLVWAWWADRHRMSAGGTGG
jgi:hypothetical protein